MNAFRQLLAPSPATPPMGTWIMSASPLMAEAVGHSGFDWAVVDMEHTPLDMMEVIHLLQALAGTRLVPVVRVPWNDTVTIKRVLDAGATTLLVPFVQNADEAHAAVAATRYPPDGRRGMAGMSRASRFGTDSSYLQTANQGVSVIVQLETPAAVAQLEAIAAVPGVDALFVGPGDLSASMGHGGQPMHPEVLALTTDAVRRAHAAGKPIGTVGGQVAAVKQYQAMGFDYLAIASDMSLMVRSAQAALAELKTPAANGHTGDNAPRGVY